MWLRGSETWWRHLDAFSPAKNQPKLQTTSSYAKPPTGMRNNPSCYNPDMAPRRILDAGAGTPLSLFAVIHDLALEPAWRLEWIEVAGRRSSTMNP